MRRQLISLIFILIIFITYTLFKALQLFPEDPNKGSFLAITLFIVMLAGQFVPRMTENIYDMLWFKALVSSSSLIMGFWSTWVMISLPVDLAHLISVPFFPTLNFQPLNQIIFIFSLLTTFLGFFQVLRGPKIKNISVKIANLPEELHHFTIAQISDLHVGPTIRKNYVEDVVEKTNSTNPDIIVLTGDIADSKAQSIQKNIEPLKNLKSKHGSYYVTGNHEYYWGVNEILSAFENLNLIPLLNQNKIIHHNSRKVLIAGVTDPMGASVKHHAPDILKASATADNPDFKIILAHRPNVYTQAEPLGFDLQFSGHTHAGQFFPFSLLIPLAHKFYRGLYQHGGLSVYVNPGTGYWGPANRFAVASEITVVKLIAKSLI